VGLAQHTAVVAVVDYLAGLLLLAQAVRVAVVQAEKQRRAETVQQI
jgi:crotonobetainyl-CoA:carnitine CoA-transferase CaiB-like acyl-CoA transferase